MFRRTIALLVLLQAVPCLAGEEDSVKESFTRFQAAVKAKDADKLWDLLDTSSQEQTEKTAKKFKDAYAKASNEQKEKLEENLGLGAAELAGLTGKLYLKSARYHGKYDEVPGSSIENITIEEKKATVFYKEEDGDKKELKAAKQGGKWKLIAAP